MEELYAQHCQRCDTLADPPQVVNLSQQEDAMIESVVKHVFEGKSKLPFDRKSTRLMAKSLLKAMEEGYGSALSDLTPGTPDYNMMQALGRNIYVFSAAKDWQMCKEITRHLVEDGKVVSFGKFRQKSAETLKQWVGPWMQAEYQHALAASQMASNWMELENSPATKLRYLTVNDRRVRPSHAKLNNVCLPKDDTFWNTWYPPNGWLCRCNVISDSSGRLTDKSKIEYPDTKEAPESFRFNPGKKKVIFPPDHPYYNATTKAELVKALADMPREYQFDKIGEKTFEHIFAQPDDNDIRPIAKKLEKYGRRVEIMPIIDIAVGADGKPIDDVLIELKNKVFPELHDIVKNPDLRLDDKYYDFTRQKKPNDLEKVIRGKVKDKKKQGTIAVIQLIEAAPESEINAISKRILKGEKVQEVIISTVDGELIFVNINGLPK